MAVRRSARNRSATRSAGRYGRPAREGAGAWVWWLSTAVLAALIGGGAWFAFNVSRGDAIDAATLCPPGGATGSLAVLLDLTDPLSATQAMSLRASLDGLIAEAPRGTLVSLGVVSDDPADWGAVGAVCKPMTGAEAGDLIRNSRQVGALYETRFMAPLRAELSAMLDRPQAAASPVMEGLQALLAGTAAMPVEAGAPRRVVIVSDLLQHSEAMSFYRGNDWESFRASPAFGRLARSLDGAEIVILRIPRPGANIPDPGAVDDFWVRYFDAQGAARVTPRALGDL